MVSGFCGLVLVGLFGFPSVFWFSRVFFFFFFFFLFLCPFCIPPVFLGVPLHFFYKFFYLPIQKKTKKKMANLLYEFMKILNMRPLTIFL